MKGGVYRMLTLIKGFKGKKGCSFDAALTFDDSFNLKLSFPKPKGAKGK